MKTLLIWAALATSALAETAPIVVKADLAGNGQSASYTLKIDQGATDEPFSGGTLSSGKTTIDLGDDFHGYSAELKVHRVSGDTKRQILEVSAIGESDWVVRLLFTLKGGSLTQVGEISGQGDMKLPGNGTIIAENWMGFWMKTEKYVFDKDLNISPKAQEFYSVDVEGTVLKSFPVYQKRDGKSVLANTKLNSKFKVLLWDPASRKADASTGDFDFDSEWYLIKTESGFVGWTQGKNLTYDFAELPWAG